MMRALKGAVKDVLCCLHCLRHLVISEALICRLRTWVMQRSVVGAGSLG
jgi:hypothetical protein